MQELGNHNREGLGRKSNRRLSIVFLLAISLMMFSFSLYGAQASVFEKARATLLDAAEPVLSLFSAPIRWADNRFGDITDYFNYLEQNKRLREENAELRVWMNEAVTLRQQVAYYEQLLDVRMETAAAPIDARVVGEAGGPYRRALIINAGRDQSVEKGDAVIDTEGMVGHIVTAGRSASRVLMLTDFSSRIPVFVEGAGIEAILAGRFPDEPVLLFLETRDAEEIGSGMRIVTSGTGGKLPRGIPVGSIGNVGEKEITVRLFAKYNSTDAVRVLDYAFVEEEITNILDDAEETAASNEAVTE
ncbi:MAG: rod shape-determining protein MreC [Aquisalinus sp.]|nr:rod shape-determining protein MreC [Aquisalinus sp.]